MSETFRPESDSQVAELLSWALAEELPLELRGRGSKAALGRPSQAEKTLDLSGLSSILLYEPDELVLKARAGTPLAEIEAALEEKNQQLAFEPCDLGPLLGGPAGEGSIGGVFACNLSGPRRIKAGAARDHFLGVAAYSGRAEAFKSGGRVVKNVTGYDLCKVMAGSYGTLAAMTEVTVKVLPAPEKTRTVLVFGLDEEKALLAMTQAMTSSHEVSGAAHLPAALAARSGVSLVSGAGGSVTALRVEGPGGSVAHRCAALRETLGALSETEELHSHNSQSFWAELRDVRPFVEEERAVWRISVAPQAGPAVGKVVAGLEGADCFYDWGGGLVWAAVSLSGDLGAEALRGAVAAAGGGHATLVRAPSDYRASLPVFQPLEPVQAALSQRIKESFDPKGLLNPGRMTAGV
jgi:glycolate oxidase FAD binding subunit